MSHGSVKFIVISRGGQISPVNAAGLGCPEEQRPGHLGPGGVEEAGGELGPGDGAPGVAVTRIHGDQVIHQTRGVICRQQAGGGEEL